MSASSTAGAERPGDRPGDRPARRRPRQPVPAGPPWPWLDRGRRFSWFKSAVLLALFVSALHLLWLWWSDNLWPEPFKTVIRVSGEWTIRALLISLALTPARYLLQWQKLTQVQRMTGLSALCWGLLHLVLYTAEQGFRLGTVASEIVLRFYLTIGFVALLGLAVLGWTSTDGALRRLGARWKRLHRIVYGIAALGILHFFIQSKADVTEPVLMAGFYAWLMLWRLLPATRRRSLPVLLGLAVVAGLGTAGIEYAWYALATGIPPGRVLAANLDVSFGFRPAVWVAIIAAGVALLPVLRDLAGRLAPKAP
jgi:sulfoxide reductase heme-binding subunit YedZ